MARCDVKLRNFELITKKGHQKFLPGEKTFMGGKSHEKCNMGNVFDGLKKFVR